MLWNFKFIKTNFFKIRSTQFYQRNSFLLLYTVALSNLSQKGPMVQQYGSGRWCTLYWLGMMTSDNGELHGTLSADVMEQNKMCVWWWMQGSVTNLHSARLDFALNDTDSSEPLVNSVEQCSCPPAYTVSHTSALSGDSWCAVASSSSSSSSFYLSQNKYKQYTWTQIGLRVIGQGWPNWTRPLISVACNSKYTAQNQNVSFFAINLRKCCGAI